MISGYDPAIVREHLLDTLTHFTGSAINARLARLADTVRDVPQPVLLPLGENCAAAIRLRQLDLPNRSSGPFDNLVVPLDGLIALLDADFADILSLRNLRIDEWEGQDSVLDTAYHAFFHHYFHMRDGEKRACVEGVERRRIDDTDIPLFLASVRAQFEYLIGKFRILLRAEVAKRLFFRRVAGTPIAKGESDRLRAALAAFGARQTELVIVHSEPFSPDTAYDRTLHRLIEQEPHERWGPLEAWREIASRAGGAMVG